MRLPWGVRANEDAPAMRGRGTLTPNKPQAGSGLWTTPCLRRGSWSFRRSLVETCFLRHRKGPCQTPDYPWDSKMFHNIKSFAQFMTQPFQKLFQSEMWCPSCPLWPQTVRALVDECTPVLNQRENWGIPSIDPSNPQKGHPWIMGRC